MRVQVSALWTWRGTLDRGAFLFWGVCFCRARLEGTTWYHHHMWPATYWRWWPDYIIHTIHLRVLRHVKQLSEAT